MFRKLLYLYIALLFAAFMYTSCGCPPDDHCVSFDSASLFSYDSSGDTTIRLSVESPVKGEFLSFKVIIENTLNPCYNKSINPFVTSAYATSKSECGQYPLYYNDTVRNIVITADKSYSTVHPAGTGLNDYFILPYGEDISNTISSSFNISAIKGPSESGVYTYTVIFNMTSGKQYQAVSEPLNIVK